MPLLYLLYRCPRCGNDAMEGGGDEARCPACGTEYARGGEGGRLRVREKEGSEWSVASHRLAAAVDAWNDRATDGIVGDGRGAGVIRAASVEVRRARTEAPVAFKGEVLGFVEQLGPPSEGVLELSSLGLVLRSVLESEGSEGGSVEGRGGDADGVWPLLDLRAIQTSSSSLQISPSTGGIVQFRFRGDSPRRWEDLLRRALREAYRQAGRGEILEFQPRIVTR